MIAEKMTDTQYVEWLKTLTDLELSGLIELAINSIEYGDQSKQTVIDLCLKIKEGERRLAA